MARRKIAVVLFNLGGPDGPEAVRPFLFNLFNDPAIIGLPGLIRTPLAKMISSRREESAKANYAIMGGASPLLPETRAQAAALEAALAAPGDEDQLVPGTDELEQSVAVDRRVGGNGSGHAPILPPAPQSVAVITLVTGLPRHRPVLCPVDRQSTPGYRKDPL